LRLAADPVRDALHAVQQSRPALDAAVRQTLITEEPDAA
jgi:hypothetical protein